MSSDGLHVRGGAAGVAVTTEGMHAGAARMRDVSAELAAYTQQAGGIALHPALLLTAGLDPVGSVAVHESAMSATVGPSGLVPTGNSVFGLGAMADAAAVAYEVAETGAERAFEAGEQVLATPVMQPAVRVALGVGVALGIGAGGTWVARRAAATLPAGVTRTPRTVTLLPIPGSWPDVQLSYTAYGFDSEQWLDVTEDVLRADGQSALTWLANHPRTTQRAVSLMPILLRSVGLVPETDGRPGAGVPELALAGTAFAPYVGLFRQGEVSARVRSGGKPVQTPTNVAGLLREASALGANKEASAVKFIRRGDRWIVIPPATQDWSPVSGQNPANLGSNVVMFGGRAGGPRANSTEALVKAMREAGVGPDDEVMLVGHSQAGITAVDLASDPHYRDEFTIKAVVTAASPVGAHDVPADVQVLSIANHDVVPQLDGVNNPDKANHTTVTAFAPDLPGGPKGERAAGAFHGLDEYGVIADQIDRSQHPSIEAWRDAASPFLAGGPGEETIVEVTRELPAG